MIEYSGSIKQFSSLRYESVHLLAKDRIDTSKNVLNLPSTLAQDYLDKLNFSNFLSKPSYSVAKSICRYNILNHVPKKYHDFINLEYDLMWLVKLEQNGIVYQPGNYYALKFNQSFEIVQCDAVFAYKDCIQREHFVILGKICEIENSILKDSYFKLKVTERLTFLKNDNLYTPRILFVKDEL